MNKYKKIIIFNNNVLLEQKKIIKNILESKKNSKDICYIIISSTEEINEVFKEYINEHWLKINQDISNKLDSIIYFDLFTPKQIFSLKKFKNIVKSVETAYFISQFDLGISKLLPKNTQKLLFVSVDLQSAFNQGNEWYLDKDKYRQITSMTKIYCTQKNLVDFMYYNFPHKQKCIFLKNFEKE